MIFFVPMCQIFWHMGTGQRLCLLSQPSDTLYFFLTFSLSAQCVRHFAPISSNLGSEPTKLTLVFFETFFFKKKKKFSLSQKITSVNFVGSDPRLLEIGAKWRTHWALKQKVKKNKGCQRLAQEAQPSDLYPYARKPDTWVQKKIIKKQQKSLFI